MSFIQNLDDVTILFVLRYTRLAPLSLQGGA